MAHVVLEIELRLVDPDRPALLERHELHALPVARYARQARFDQVQEVAIRRRLAFEDGHGADVHVGRAVLQLQEQCVQRTEALEPRLHPVSVSQIVSSDAADEATGRANSCASAPKTPCNSAAWIEIATR